MNKNREEWIKRLPVLQAFCEGRQVQVKGHDGRWADTDTMYSVLNREWRMKPEVSTPGVWTVEYTVSRIREGITGRGVLEWAGSDSDTPEWPVDSTMVYYMATVKFTPKTNG